MAIQRIETGPRMSQVVVHDNRVYLAGIVANKTAGESVTRQTQEILSIIDGHLAKAGTDKSKLLTATIYITDMKTFAEMNAVWDAKDHSASAALVGFDLHFHTLGKATLTGVYGR